MFEVNDIEALAALRGLQLMIFHWGISSLVLEGDSSFIIKAMKSREPNISKQDPIIVEIHHLLQSFKDYKAFHVGCPGNQVAHLLARHSQLVENTVQWWHQCLDFIVARVLVDAGCN